MQKKMIYMIVAGMIALTGCAGVGGGADTQIETVEENEIESENDEVSVDEAVNDEVKDETISELEAESVSEEVSSGESETQLANPWKTVTEEEAKSATTRIFSIPEGATNVRWSMMEESDGQGPLIQAVFDLDGKEYTARTEYGAEEYADISGMNYAWTETNEGNLSTWFGGGMKAKFYKYKGDEYAYLCTWYDIEIGIAYSVSAAGKDLENCDIKAVAEAMATKDIELY